MDQELKYKELVAKMLQEDITPDESLELELLLESSEAAKTYLQKMKILYGNTDLDKEFNENLDLDKSYKFFQENREVQQPVYERDATEDDPSFTKATEDEGKETKVIPMNSNGAILRTVISIAAVLLICLGAFYFMQDDDNVLEPQQQLVQVSAEDKTADVNLVDNSIVKLNINSKLNYPETFNGEERVVILEGEAFFEVAPNTEQPFIIHVGDGRIKVVGTAFNVNANNPDSIVVTVKEGKVIFFNVNNPEEVLLEMGKKGTLQHNLATIAEENDNDNYLFWYNDILLFDEEPLKNVVASLNKYLNANVNIADSVIEDCTVTGSFKEPNLEEILELIELTLGFTVESVEGKYVISGDGC